MSMHHTPGRDLRQGTPAAAGRDDTCAAVLLLLLATLTTVTSAADTTPAARDDAGYRSTVEPFFRDHCLGCHGPTKPEGDFSLDASALGDDFGDPVMRGRWREVVNVLDGHQMPPDTEPRPDPERVAAVVDWITARAVAAEAARREATIVLRRLNRAEYAATIRDLVGVDFDASIFPQDPPAGGFDNNGAALTISPMQMDQYLAAADEILSRALVEGERPEPVRWRFDPEPGSSDRTRVRLGDRNNPIVKAGHNRHEGEWVVVHHEHWDQFNVRDFRVPHAGTYAIRVRVAGRRPGRDEVVRSAEAILAERRDKQDRERPDRAAQHREQMERDLAHFADDRMYDYGPARLKLVLQLGSQPRTVAEFDVPGSVDEAEVREFHARFTTETAGVTLGYAYSIPKVLENFWMQGRDEFARPEAFIDWIEIEGPLVDAWPPASHTGILDPEALAASDETAAAREVLARFMAEAWRRPVEPDEVDAKLALFAEARDAGLSFVASIRRPLVAVLVSPHFLYLDESRGAAPDAHALAARLSYFLWSSQPDQELRRLADAGRLVDPAVREEQVDRLLADARSARFVTNFVGQWLGLREVGANPPAADLFPHYDRHLEESIVRESEAFFAEFLHGDLDARGLIASDFVTINERLARFYGIAGVRGDTFRRVEVPPDVRRGGIVTQASILTITSNGTRTSPVKRGTWILKNLLDTDPGLPVANAGEIAPKVPGIDKATVRQRLEVHRTLPQCARCHARIDPLGFALENYDASGAWRDREGFGYKGRVQQNDPVIDASSRMPDGRAIDGVEGLQQAMLEMDGRFLEALAARMLTYALGRELGLADRPTVARCVARMRAEGTTVRALVKAIVTSDAFVTR
jgi:mono/diheme cytochrome c family protein